VATCTVLASSDAMPKLIQDRFFDPYHFKSVPLLLVWVEIQRRLWARGPARTISAAPR
jgi:hypothetical protein